MKNLNIKNKMNGLWMALVCITTLTTGAFSHAESTDAANRFNGYLPTVLETEAKVKALFSKMETGFKDFKPILLQFGSQCTARAETWTYEMDKVDHVNAQKVFVFYTKAYHQYYAQKHGKPFKWWFHVSPYVLVKGANGAAEERVMDREFSDKPQTMKEWTDIFIESQEACIENVPYASFEGDIESSGASYNKNAHCYIVRAPMTDMFPADIDARERGLRAGYSWDMNEVNFALRALPRKERKAYSERVGL